VIVSASSTPCTESGSMERMSTGRPRSEYPLRYQVRHTAEQMGAWKAAAQAEDRDLQNWIRRTLDAAAKKTRRKP
jgi:hypothetical protein